MERVSETASENPSLCLSPENKEPAELDISQHSEMEQEPSENTADDSVSSTKNEKQQNGGEDNVSKIDQESMEISVDVSSDSSKSESKEHVIDESMSKADSSEIELDLSSDSTRGKRKPSVDTFPAAGEESSEIELELSSDSTRSKRKLSVDTLPAAENGSPELVSDVSSTSSRSKRKRSISEDKVAAIEAPEDLSLSSPSLSSTPKVTGVPAELKTKESEIVIKVEEPDPVPEDSTPVHYSSSGRKISRKSFSDEYMTPNLGKMPTVKEEKPPVQYSSSGRKISKKSFGDDVHTPPLTAISPVVLKTIKSEKKNVAGDIIKPFTMGWMREVVFRSTTDSPHGAKRKADIYYFTPEGTKLRSMPEIGAYLNKHRITSLQISNFTFLKEAIYREPFEKERDAKIKPGTPIFVPLKPKKEAGTDSKSGSATEEKRVPKLKLPFTFPSPVKNSNKTASVKEEKPKEQKPTELSKKTTEQLKRTASKQVGSDQNVAPKRKKNETTSLAEKKKIDLNPLLVSTKKLLLPQQWETESNRRCSKQCVDSHGEAPSLQCKKCLCLFHPRCVSIKLKKHEKYNFICRLCAADIEGSTRSTKQEMNDSNHVTEKNTGVSSGEEFSEINLIPEVLLEQNPHDPPIKQLAWKNKDQPNIPLSRPYCGPPPLKRAPDADRKKRGNPRGSQSTSGLETNNGPPNTAAVCSPLPPGSKLPPLLPAGTFILRNRLIEDKPPSSSPPPMAHPVNNFSMAGGRSVVSSPSAAISYVPFSGETYPPGSSINLSIKTMPPPGKNVRAPRILLPVSNMNAPPSPTVLQGHNTNSTMQQVNLTPYNGTILVSNTVVTYRKVNDNVSSSMNVSDKTNRQPLKMCDFNIVSANGADQVCSSGAVGNNIPSTDGHLSVESTNNLSSHVTKRNQLKSEKHNNDSSLSDQKDTSGAMKIENFEFASPKMGGALASSDTSSQEDNYPSSELVKLLKNSVHDYNAVDSAQLQTDSKPKGNECSPKKRVLLSSYFGINKLMWGFDALNIIFGKLPVNDLLRASQVCRSWRNLASQHFLWRNISLRDQKIRNWKRCANALRRYRTSSLDLRGLQHITDSGNTWREFVGIIKFLKHLEKIVFGQVPPSVVTTLGEFLTQLRSLECYCLTEICEEPDLWSSSCTFDFNCIKNLKQLERLRIRSANEMKVSSEVLASALCDLPCLQHLSLTSFSNLHGSHFTFLKKLPNLLSLELGDTKHWKYENFAILAELPNLQALRLDNGGDVSDTGLAEAIIRMKDLQELRLINYKIPTNLGAALKKVRSLRRLSIWPDNSSDAARVNYNALEAVSKAKKLTYFCWGILIADGNQDLTDGCRPLVDVLKYGGDDGKTGITAENALHLSSVELLERLYYLLPNVEVQVECIHRSKFNKYWTVHK